MSISVVHLVDGSVEIHTHDRVLRVGGTAAPSSAVDQPQPIPQYPTAPQPVKDPRRPPGPIIVGPRPRTRPTTSIVISSDISRVRKDRRPTAWLEFGRDIEDNAISTHAAAFLRRAAASLPEGETMHIGALLHPELHVDVDNLAAHVESLGLDHPLEIQLGTRLVED